MEQSRFWQLDVLDSLDEQSLDGRIKVKVLTLLFAIVKLEFPNKTFI